LAHPANPYRNLQRGYHSHQANKGIGFETAKQLLQKEFYVYIGSRTLENGIQAVEKLKVEGLTNVEAIQIDVTDYNSVKNA